MVIDSLCLACRWAIHVRFFLRLPRREDSFMEAAGTLLAAVHLWPLREQPVAELSHGQQRQLELALALAGAPRLIPFDDAAAGLSPRERRAPHPLLQSLPPPMGFLPIVYLIHAHPPVPHTVTLIHPVPVFPEGPPPSIAPHA